MDAGDHAARPSARALSTGTYRLQLTPDFGFNDAAGVADYVAALGVSHLYLSPILQAVPGSMHGYDVVDHRHLSAELGGADDFAKLSAAAGEHDLGILVDVVPNHMAVPTPEWLNEPLWSVLRDGPQSPYAGWFDVAWGTETGPDGQRGTILMPVLGERIGRELAADRLKIDSHDGEAVLRYSDHVFPVRPGTADLRLPDLLDRQWYRLAHWQVADEELNYRRFFDVDTLVAVRTEDPAVFRATHELLLTQFADGVIDGFRIDHPDGLADPRGYLRMLSAAAPGAWVVVEKILEGHEQLPADWPCAGTTGYDALNLCLGVLVDPAGAEPLAALWNSMADPELRDMTEVVDTAKRYVLSHSLRAEVNRLADLAHGIADDDIQLRDLTRRGLQQALEELLVQVPVYRAYVVPGEPAPEDAIELVEGAATRARTARPERSDEIDLLRDLALGRLGGGGSGRRDEFCVRFQQTCGPVMAKGIEDTAFYRWHRLIALNEVGAEPGRFGVTPDVLHAWATQQQGSWPQAMTTLSTHDTKRSEDVRARLAVLSEATADWAEAVEGWRGVSSSWHSPEAWPDAETEYLLWQTLVGAWPVTPERLIAFLQKASREAKLHTTWTQADPAYDEGLESFARSVLADESLCASISAFVESLAPAFASNVLSQKLLQLTLPGVPDVYQGCEVVDLSLVDPDNRRPVDYASRRQRLARLDAGHAPEDLDDAKLLVTSRALRLRRERPRVYRGSYAPVATTSQHALGFVRADSVVTLTTRLPRSLAAAGGWGAAVVVLPEGRWTDRLTGRSAEGGSNAVGELLADLPVALLVQE